MPGGVPFLVLGNVTLNKDKICYSVSNKFQLDPEILSTQLSFTHIRRIMSIDDPMERYFYELEYIKCGWSVRELDKQISSKLFFRAGPYESFARLFIEENCHACQRIFF